MVQMATRATAEKNADSVQKQAGELRYVARQPILDLGGKAHGYELLFWNGREPIGRPQGDMATRTMLDNTILFGLEKLSRGLPAFVNCTAESVTSEWVKVLPPRMTVPSGRPMAWARRLIMRQASLRCIGRGVRLRWRSMLRKRGVFLSAAMPAAAR